MAVDKNIAPVKFSIAIYKIKGKYPKNSYAHACADCGAIRFFNGRRVATLRCQSCAVRFRQDNPKRPAEVCGFCGMAFRYVWRRALARASRFCSLTCHNADQAKRGLSKRVKKACRHCGRVFYVKTCYAKRCDIQSCSRSCAIAHHLWINCAHCNRRFNARHNTTRRFCSKRCYLSSWSESRIERRVRATLETYRLSFETQFPVKGAHHFDFYIPSLNLLIEADGTYWHSRPWSKERDAKKTAKAESLGYNVERFPESVIMSPSWVQAFHLVITRYLRKRGNSDIRRGIQDSASALSLLRS